MSLMMIDALRDRLTHGAGAPALYTGDEVWSFARLAARVQPVLDLLAGLDAGPPVLISGHKEADAVAAMLACMLCGRPFVFLDRSNPPDRGRRIAALSGAGDMLCAAAPPEIAQVRAHPLSALESRAFDGAGCDPAVPDAALLYLIFTSGSTGEPKGVPISRSNFAAFEGWYRPMLAALPGQDLPAAQSAHVNHASLAFDMGMLDLWPVLALGRPVILLDHRNNILPFRNTRLLSGLSDLRARSWFSTPSLLQMMCTDPAFSEAALPELRCFFVGGETVQRSLVEDILRRFPKAEVRHAYGPSEVTCMTHVHRLTADDLAAEGPLPLGPVLAPSSLRIVDEAGQELPPGEVGEVELSGPQVVGGYLPADHPANRAFFMRDGRASYRSGDFGKLDARGNLILSGRMDRQVKWNGNRIELDEIERAAHELPGIARAVCLPMREAGRVVDIVLCVLPEPGTGVPCPQQLARGLHALLPQTMVPRDIHVLQDFPATVNGKVDAAALLARCRPQPALVP
ncbi:MAG: AMP-binding protein [Sphingomonadales bacterium]|nr:AMP-binding protein [Sphingomonadales bacterium]